MRLPGSWGCGHGVDGYYFPLYLTTRSEDLGGGEGRGPFSRLENRA